MYTCIFADIRLAISTVTIKAYHSRIRTNSSISITYRSFPNASLCLRNQLSVFLRQPCVSLSSTPLFLCLSACHLVFLYVDLPLSLSITLTLSFTPVPKPNPPVLKIFSTVDSLPLSGWLQEFFTIDVSAEPYWFFFVFNFFLIIFFCSCFNTVN